MKFAIRALLFIALSSIGFAKPPVTEGETDPVMLDLDPYMIDALRGGKSQETGKNIPPGRFGSEGGLADLLQEDAFNKLVKKHDLLLFNGPMLGDVSSSSVRIWIRTAGEVSFQVVAGEVESETVRTLAKDDFTGVVTLEGLKPFSKYSYTIILDGKRIQDDSFCFQTYPESGAKKRYSVSFGACARYVPTNEGIWRTMASTQPLAYLGLGDNVYIDATERRDVQRLHYYRRMLRAEYREFIAQIPQYAVWDDHDMGMDDSAGGAGLDEPWKLLNLEVFKQNWNNPSYGSPKAPGTWHSFRVGDAEFFMLDGRFYRSDIKNPDDVSSTMLGKVQKEWLLRGLKESTATFKVLGSGTMWHDKADKGGRDSWAGERFQGERDEIFDFINEHEINGVVLLAGDRHRTDIWKTERPKGYPLYEFVSAKVTNLHTHDTRKQAEWSYNQGNFWGELVFDFTEDDPSLIFRAIDSKGTELKAFSRKLSELSH